MKVYKHDQYKDCVLLAYPTRVAGRYYGIPYYYSNYCKLWTRGNVASGFPYYFEKQLSHLECLGDTDTNWEFHNDKYNFNSSYLKEKHEQ